ncbi:hypothetical protein DCOP10_12018 [Armatimonadetes bacterium DC]|nr:hypothetical protein DCOP10_12018 [Armatimonadetes bacterium DC]
MRWTLLLVGLLCASLWAQNELNPGEDERLSQKLTVRAVGLPLRDLLTQLSQRTKVALKVEPAMQEYRACLYAKDKPLHEILSHLAGAFGFQWKREKPSEEAPYQYRLVAPPEEKPQTREGDLREFREKVLAPVCAQLQTPIEARFQQLMQAAEQGRSALSPKELEALMPVYRSVDLHHIAVWYALCQMGEEEWRRLARGEALFFSTRFPNQIAPRAIDDWKAVMREQIKFYEREYGANESRQRQMEKMDSVNELRAMVRYDANEKALKVAYEALADGKQVVLDGSQYASPEISLWSANEPGYQSPNVEPEPPLPAKHPVLSRQLTQFNEPGPHDDWFQWLSELMVQMAEATDAPLAAEYYPLQTDTLIMQDWNNYRPRLPQDWYAFQSLLRGFGYRVRLNDSGWVVIESRQRRYARENDIPHPTLQRWLFKPNRRGVLTFDECAEVAALSSRQRDALYMYIQSFGSLHDLLEGVPYVPAELDFLHGGLLHAQRTLIGFVWERGSTTPSREPEEGILQAMQLYATLKPAQRTQLRAGGIPFSQLTPAQQWLFLLAYTRGNLLTLDDFWLPPAQLQARMQSASIRLMSETRVKEGVRIPADQKPPIRTLEDWKRYHRQVRLEKVPLRFQVWRFELRWGEDKREIALELPLK